MEYGNKPSKVKIWGKRLVFFAVFGFTGIAALYVFNVYRMMRGLDKIKFDDIDWER